MKKSKDGWVWEEVTFSKWRSAVDRRFLDIYAISIVDAGIDEADLMSHWKDKEPAFEYVLWFANKYDLDASEAFGQTSKNR